MSDGRLEVYGAEKFSKLQDMSPENFPRLDEQYHFGVVLLHYSFVSSNRILEKLHFDPEWELTYVDDVAAIFVRVPKDGVALYPDLDLNAPDLFSPLRGKEDRYDKQRRVSRANFYYSLHEVDHALRVWEESAALYPEMPGRYTTYAIFLQANGRYKEAEAVLREWIREDPNDAERHAFVADHYRTQGNLILARDHYDIAIELDPDHFQSLMVRGVLFEQEGQIDKATALYERIVERLHPAVPIARQASQRLEALRASR
jgi:tetratricopeptide (TPR) repeat protein